MVQAGQPVCGLAAHATPAGASSGDTEQAKVQPAATHQLQQADGLSARQGPGGTILTLPASSQHLAWPAGGVAVSPPTCSVEEAAAPSRPRRSAAEKGPSPDDAVLLMSLRGLAGTAQAAGSARAAAPAQASPPVSQTSMMWITVACVVRP